MPRSKLEPAAGRKLLAAAAGLAGFFAAAPALLGAEGEAGHGASSGGLAETIQQYLKTAGWGLIAFTIVLLILWKKLFPPITAALDKRARTIQESLDAARRAKEEAEAVMARHQDSLEKARVEARAIIEEGKADAMRVKESIVESARKESEEIAARAKRDINLAKSAVIDDLYRQASKLSFDLAEKVIQKSLRPEDHQGLIADSIQKYKQDVKVKEAG